MKLRIGFVTNSSSSSFTIAKSDLTDEQIEKIKNYFEAAKKVGMNDFDDLWDIDETNFNINGFTCMNNGDMLKFLRLIGVDRDNIEWEELS
jgi:hypothetical protein